MEFIFLLLHVQNKHKQLVKANLIIIMLPDLLLSLNWQKIWNFDTFLNLKKCLINNLIYISHTLPLTHF